MTKQIGLTLRDLVASFLNDIAEALGKVGASLFALVTFSVAIGIYIKLCQSSIIKITEELTNYAIKIHDVFHE